MKGTLRCSLSNALLVAFNCLVFLIVLTSAQSSKAATFQPILSDECKIILRGPIISGDLARLTKAVTDNKIFSEHPEVQMAGDSDATLCLDSDGGSFVEGVLIAKYVSKSGIGTVIRANEKCLSACAIIFMAGRTRGDEVDRYNRALHHKGSLGFHRPFMELPTRSEYKAEEILAAFDAAMESVATLLSLNNELGDFSNSRRLRSTLFEQILRHKGGDLLLIDTVDKAGKWEIAVYGFSYPITIGDREIYNACANYITWAIGEPNGDHYDTTEREKFVAEDVPGLTVYRSTDYKLYKITPAKAGFEDVECAMYVAATGKAYATMALCASDGFVGVQYGNCEDRQNPSPVYLSALFAYSPDLRLSDLPSHQTSKEAPLPSNVI